MLIDKGKKEYNRYNKAVRKLFISEESSFDMDWRNRFN